MPITRSSRSLATIPAGIIAIGFAAIVGTAPAREAPAQIASPAYPIVQPPNRNLDASLYVQTAAEYRACYYQAYNLAIARLKEKLAKQSGPKRPAVVMDLDETVFNNSAFRATLVRNGLDYDNRIWDAWQEFGVDRVTLLPGAKNFIVEANNNGVAVVFVSNRDERFREQTKKIFARFGIPLPEEALLKLKRFETDSDDKTSRFKEAERDHTVLLYLGDNLRDFDETLGFEIPNNATGDNLDRFIQIRKEAVDRDSAIFGDKWIILPNPVYGDWIAPLGRGYDDFNRLAPPVPEILPGQLRVISRAAKVMTTSTVIILCVASFVGGSTLVLLLLKLKARAVEKVNRGDEVGL